LKIAASLQQKKRQTQCHQQASLKNKMKLIESHDLISLEKLRHNILRHLL
jgi:hypothetical protein